ncbi:MAG: AraC family transcriptional regulator [Candidatus Sphingomonas colombiensis]|nr:AraC family transcriptional regulator [Sphingomonas sp.]WEK41762.1 MAG: AraC family transcriptional regulator [Sphingomonas sp.]
MSIWLLDAPDGFGDARPHAHHAIQLTISLSGGLELRNDDFSERGPAIAVDADVPHRFQAHGLLAIIFVEPESRSGRALRRILFADRALASFDAGPLAPALAPLAAAFDAETTADQLLQAGQQAVSALLPEIRAPLPDPRIRRVIDRASMHLDDSLERAADAAGVHLSSSRLRHLFVEQTGLAFRTYLLWLRLVRALDVYAQGKSLTEAAHAAGFADSAHLSRTFKRNFGLPATTLERL